MLLVGPAILISLCYLCICHCWAIWHLLSIMQLFTYRNMALILYWKSSPSLLHSFPACVFLCKMQIFTVSLIFLSPRKCSLHNNTEIGPLLDARARGFIQPLWTFPLDTKIPALYQVLSIPLFLSFYHNPAEQEIISSKKTKAQRLPWWLSDKESACQCRRKLRLREVK